MLTYEEWEVAPPLVEGTECILYERGDAPAQEVLDRNARSLAQRMADETREELAKVMRRVDNIYCAFDMQNSMYSTNTNTNLEYVGDMDELEDLISDQVKKHKYQQQVTVFIVGYQSTCTQKFRLLQQVNDFFIDNSGGFETDDDSGPAEEVDLDSVGNSIEESLEYAQTLAERLGSMHQEIVEFATNLSAGKGNKGRKKLEKQLTSAKEDIAALNEKLTRAQLELEEKEEKIQGLYRTVELRSSEVQRFKTAAEAAKKSVQEADRLRVEIAKRDEKLNSLDNHLVKLEREIADNEKKQQQKMTDLAEAESQAEAKIHAMKEDMEHQQNHFDRLTSDLVKEQDKQVAKLRETMERQCVEMQEKHTVEKLDMQEKIEELKRQLALAKDNVADVEEQIEREKTNAGIDASVSGSKKSKSNKRLYSTMSKKDETPAREFSDVGVQHASRSQRSSAKSSDSKAVVTEFEDTIDIDADEEIWENLPKGHVAARFRQFREMAGERISALETEIKDLTEKMQKKVHTMKAQYSDHKGRWEQERSELILKVEAALKQQNSAETDADQIMETLEKFVDEQEDMEAASRLNTAPSRPTTEPNENITDDDKAAMSRAEDHDEPDEITEEDTVKEDMEEARSRASARSRVRGSVEETKSMMSERRAKSSAASLRSQKTVLSDMELDEDGDLPIPLDTEDTGVTMAPADQEDSLDLAKASTAEVKVSSMSARHSHSVADHPVVQEFVKLYSIIVELRNKIPMNHLDKSDDLKSIEHIELDKESRIQPQLETMTKQAGCILDLLLKMISSERIPGGPGEDMTDNDAERSIESGQISVLQQQITRLEQIIQDTTDKYENELNKKGAVITKLEQKIVKLARELSLLGRVVDDETPQKVPEPEVPIMFTRLDMERNGKLMKRAVNIDKLQPDRYQEALETMDSYVSIPARRFVHLVRKYVHHRQMRDIEESVKKSHSLNDNVFHILDRMESLQNVRAQRWADYMDGLSAERVNLAQLLMKTLDEIEQESGIFLIKPMYSLKGRDPISSIYSKYGHATAARRRTPPVLKQQQNPDTTPRPAPPPRSPTRMGYSVQTMGASSEVPQSPRKEESAILVDRNSVWVAPLSEAHRRKFDESQTAAMWNTPRMLELDINRMLITQNAISTRLNSSDDLVRISGDGTLRSYVTINRPQATQLQKGKSSVSVAQSTLSPREGSKLPPI